MNMKYACLMVRRFFYKALKVLAHNLSYFFLIFCVVVSFMILVPTSLNRAPVFSYFIRKMELPLTYNMHGEVHVVDGEGNVINNNVIIYVGGYNADVGNSEKYQLTFSSPESNVFFVNIIYVNENGDIREFTQDVEFPENSYSIEENFIIHEIV